jgi:O-antigen ligase
MTLFAPVATSALTLGLEKSGLIAVTLLAAALLALPARRVAPRVRAALMSAALILTPALLALALWNNDKLASFHHHPLRGVALIAAVLVVVAALAVLIERHDQLLPLLAVAALPFRIPLGSVSSGLLLPLYAVIGAGAVVFIKRTCQQSAQASSEDGGASRRPQQLLAFVIVLYAVGALYSPDAGVLKAVENVGFFYVPFALLGFLLARVDWTKELLGRCLGVLLALAAVFVVVGFGEFADGSRLLLNKGLDQDARFVRINSLFYDPNVYGRFLALTMILVSILVLFERRRRYVLAGAGALALMWGGLVLSLSQSSMAALLVGLAVGALGIWGRRAALAASVLATLALAGVVALALGSGNSANFLTSGRASLVSGGVDLFKSRPLEGYGSGSFSAEYTAHLPRARTGFEVHTHLPYIPPTTSDSHTTPVTIAAEQGVVGLAAYVALLAACFWELFGGGLLTARPRGEWVARLAIAAAFTGLVVHTLFYADFLEDPATWVLLAVGGALAARAKLAEPASG